MAGGAAAEVWGWFGGNTASCGTEVVPDPDRRPCRQDPTSGVRDHGGRAGGAAADLVTTPCRLVRTDGTQRPSRWGSARDSRCGTFDRVTRSSSSEPHRPSVAAVSGLLPIHGAVDQRRTGSCLSVTTFACRGVPRGRRAISGEKRHGASQRSSDHCTSLRCRDDVSRPLQRFSARRESRTDVGYFARRSCPASG